MIKKFLLILGGIILFAAAAVGAHLIVNSPLFSPVTAESTVMDVDEEQYNTEAKKKLDATRSDVEVKNELSRMASAVMTYQANNKGNMPKTELQLGVLSGLYLSNPEAKHPMTKKSYNLSLHNDEMVGTVYYQPGYVCTDGVVVQGSSRNFALSTILSSGELYCTGS